MLIEGLIVEFIADTLEVDWFYWGGFDESFSDEFSVLFPLAELLTIDEEFSLAFEVLFPVTEIFTEGKFALTFEVLFPAI